MCLKYLKLFAVKVCSVAMCTLTRRLKCMYIVHYLIPTSYTVNNKESFVTWVHSVKCFDFYKYIYTKGIHVQEILRKIVRG